MNKLDTRKYKYANFNSLFRLPAYMIILSRNAVVTTAIRLRIDSLLTPFEVRLLVTHHIRW